MRSWYFSVVEMKGVCLSAFAKAATHLLSFFLSWVFFPFFPSPALIKSPSSVRHQARLWGHKEKLPSSGQKLESSQSRGEGADDEQRIITRGGSVRGGVGSCQAPGKTWRLRGGRADDYIELAGCQALGQCFSALFYLISTIIPQG